MVRLRQSAQYVGVGGLHQWRCRFEVDCPPEELERIARVVYTLDRSFPQPVREVTDHEDRFALEILTWAAFEVYAAVEFKDGSRELLAVALDLPLPADADTAPEVTSAAEADAPPRYEAPVLLTDEADVVLDGGGVRCIAFAGALEAAERAGINRWVHVAGSSAGALPAALLAAGYHPHEISEALLTPSGEKLFTWRAGGLPGRVTRLWRNDGLVATKYLRIWLEQRFAQSPLGKPNPTFGDLIRADAADHSAQTRYRLRLIVSDVTAARMVVLPEGLADYETPAGEPLVPEEFSLVEAVLMSMSVPFWFAPSILHRDGAPHQILDGGLLSNFPIWLFDTAHPARPTWGVRLSTAPLAGADAPALPTTALGLARDIVKAVMGAARELEPARNETRTLSVRVPADVLGPELSREDLERLHAAGLSAGRAFFASRGTYLNSHGHGLPEAALAAPLSQPVS
jgi:NTE family protein